MFQRLSILVFVCLGLFSFPSVAAEFPEKPVRLIVAFPPGGGSDSLTRIVAHKLQDIWGQSVVIENRSGAQGGIGTAAAAKAHPDGYSVGVVVQGTLAINPHVYGNVGYDPIKDFAPVVRATEQAFVLTAHPDVAAKTLDDVIALAKEKPGSLTYGTSGAGPKVVGEYMKLMTKTNLLEVPYNGSGPAVIAILAGQTDFMISNPASVLEHIKAGKLRGIAVLGSERMKQIPDVPSALESGYPELSDIPEWYGFAVPAGTPQRVVDKLNKDFVTALKDPKVQQSIEALGMGVSPSTPEEFAKQIETDYERWGKVVKEADIKQP